MATKDQQVHEVIDGLAFGLALLGVESIPKSKLDFEFAIAHAWRGWSHTGAYPSIGNSPKPDNVLWIGLGDSAGRKWSKFRFVQDDPYSDYRIVAPQWWTPDDDEDPLVGDRANDHWRALATLFVEWDGWKRK